MADKKILLIAPRFFGYYQEIINEAEKMGFYVDYLCDTSNNSNLGKAVGRINRKLLSVSMHNYFKNAVLPLVRTKHYDCVLLIAGMTFSFTDDMLRVIKKNQRRAQFIIYQWDAQKNLPYVKKIHKYFEKKYSFDRIDCLSDPTYNFLPLFYVNKYETIPDIQNSDIKYDCSYIGTAHPKKYKEINEIADAVRNKMPRQLIYHYMPSKLKYLYHKMTAVEYKKASLKDFQMRKIPSDQMMRIFAESICILDAPQEGQNGLTIRTIECLGAGRKLITTNADIVNYDFYNEKNILVYNKDIDLESPFFLDEYEQVPYSVYRKYALRNWLETMLQS